MHPITFLGKLECNRAQLTIYLYNPLLQLKIIARKGKWAKMGANNGEHWILEPWIYKVQYLNCRLMVVISWIISTVLSLPQAFMFRKLKHPAVEFYQCTTDMVVEDYSKQTVVAGKIKFIFLGLDSDTVYNIYHFSFPFFVFFFPLACLIFNYGIIIRMIRR